MPDEVPEVREPCLCQGLVDGLNGAPSFDFSSNECTSTWLPGTSWKRITLMNTKSGLAHCPVFGTLAEVSATIQVDPGETGNFSAVEYGLLGPAVHQCRFFFEEEAMAVEWTITIEGKNEFGDVCRREGDR